MAGGDRVGQLPAAMPKSISATDQVLRSGCPPEARHRVLDLLLALAAVECHVSSGGSNPLPPRLLRDLVVITTGLVGRSWLEANAEAAQSGMVLQASLHAPPLPELDHTLACLLADRFGLTRPGEPRKAGRPAVRRPAEIAVRDPGLYRNRRGSRQPVSAQHAQVAARRC